MVLDDIEFIGLEAMAAPSNAAAPRRRSDSPFRQAGSRSFTGLKRNDLPHRSSMYSNMKAPQVALPAQQRMAARFPSKPLVRSGAHGASSFSAEASTMHERPPSPNLQRKPSMAERPGSPHCRTPSPKVLRPLPSARRSSSPMHQLASFKNSASNSSKIDNARCFKKPHSPRTTPADVDQNVLSNLDNERDAMSFSRAELDHVSISSSLQSFCDSNCDAKASGGLEEPLSAFRFSEMVSDLNEDDLLTTSTNIAASELGISKPWLAMHDEHTCQEEVTSFIPEATQRTCFDMVDDVSSQEHSVARCLGLNSPTCSSVGGLEGELISNSESFQSPLENNASEEMDRLHKALYTNVRSEPFPCSPNSDQTTLRKQKRSFLNSSIASTVPSTGEPLSYLHDQSDLTIDPTGWLKSVSSDDEVQGMSHLTYDSPQLLPKLSRKQYYLPLCKEESPFNTHDLTLQTPKMVGSTGQTALSPRGRDLRSRPKTEGRIAKLSTNKINTERQSIMPKVQRSLVSSFESHYGPAKSCRPSSPQLVHPSSATKASSLIPGLRSAPVMHRDSQNISISPPHTFDDSFLETRKKFIHHQAGNLRSSKFQSKYSRKEQDLAGCDSNWIVEENVEGYLGCHSSEVGEVDSPCLDGWPNSTPDILHGQSTCCPEVQDSLSLASPPKNNGCGYDTEVLPEFSCKPVSPTVGLSLPRFHVGFSETTLVGLSKKVNSGYQHNNGSFQEETEGFNSNAGNEGHCQDNNHEASLIEGKYENTMCASMIPNHKNGTGNSRRYTALEEFGRVVKELTECKMKEEADSSFVHNQGNKDYQTHNATVVCNQLVKADLSPNNRELGNNPCAVMVDRASNAGEGIGDGDINDQNKLSTRDTLYENSFQHQVSARMLQSESFNKKQRDIFSELDIKSSLPKIPGFLNTSTEQFQIQGNYRAPSGHISEGESIFAEGKHLSDVETCTVDVALHNAASIAPPTEVSDVTGQSRFSVAIKEFPSRNLLDRQDMEAIVESKTDYDTGDHKPVIKGIKLPKQECSLLRTNELKVKASSADGSVVVLKELPDYYANSKLDKVAKKVLGLQYNQAECNKNREGALRAVHDSALHQGPLLDSDVTLREFAALLQQKGSTILHEGCFETDPGLQIQQKMMQSFSDPTGVAGDVKDEPDCLVVPTGEREYQHNPTQCFDKKEIIPNTSGMEHGNVSGGGHSRTQTSPANLLSIYRNPLWSDELINDTERAKSFRDQELINCSHANGGKDSSTLQLVERNSVGFSQRNAGDVWNTYNGVAGILTPLSCSPSRNDEQKPSRNHCLVEVDTLFTSSDSRRHPPLCGDARNLASISFPRHTNSPTLNSEDSYSSHQRKEFGLPINRGLIHADISHADPRETTDAVHSPFVNSVLSLVPSTELEVLAPLQLTLTKHARQFFSSKLTMKPDASKWAKSESQQFIGESRNSNVSETHQPISHNNQVNANFLTRELLIEGPVMSSTGGSIAGEDVKQVTYMFPDGKSPQHSQAAAAPVQMPDYQMDLLSTWVLSCFTLGMKVKTRKVQNKTPELDKLEDDDQLEVNTVGKKVEVLEAEIDKLKDQNKILQKLVKENEAFAAWFATEKNYWEQQRAHDMLFFSQHKEEQIKSLETVITGLTSQIKELQLKVEAKNEQLPVKKDFQPVDGPLAYKSDKLKDKDSAANKHVLRKAVPRTSNEIQGFFNGNSTKGSDLNRKYLVKNKMKAVR